MSGVLAYYAGHSETVELSYEAELYLTWQNTGQLPYGSLYDMPCDLMRILLEIHRQVESYAADQDRAQKEEPDASWG